MVRLDALCAPCGEILLQAGGCPLGLQTEGVAAQVSARRLL